MSQARQTFFVGIAAIIGLAALAGLLLRFGELDALFNRSYVLTVITDDAGGVRRGSLITLNGVRVGQVDEVNLDTTSDMPVRIVAMVEAARDIPDSATFEVQQGLFGGAAVIALRTEGGSTVMPRDGTATISGTYRSPIDRLAEALDERMAPLLASMESFQQLADTYNELGLSINDMLQPQDAEAIAAGEPANLRTSVERLNLVLDDARTALQLASAWLDDDQLQADARRAVERANQLIDTATTTFDRYTQLAESLDSDADKLVAQVVPVADQLSATLEEVNGVMRLASQGDGTFSHMLNSPDLYRSLNDAAIRLERALVEAQLLMQKIKAEGLPLNL